MHDTARSSAGQPDPGWAGLRRQLAAAIAAVEAAASTSRAEAVGPGQWAYMISVLRHYQAPLAARHMDESAVEQLIARAEERGFERGSAAARGHRKPGRADSRLRLVRSGGAALAALAVPARVLRHGAAAARAHASGTAAAAAPVALAGTLVLTGANSALTPYSTQAAPRHRHETAVTRTGPVPAASPAVVHVPAPRGKHHRKASRHRVLQFPAPPPSSPPPGPAPSPYPSPAAVAAGQLDVQETSIVLRQVTPGTWSAELTLYATGGPVTWTASAPGLELADADTGEAGPPGGTLAAGQAEVIDVSVPAGTVMPGQAWVITLSAPGQAAQQVTVSAGGGL